MNGSNLVVPIERSDAAYGVEIVDDEFTEMCSATNPCNYFIRFSSSAGVRCLIQGAFTETTSSSQPVGVIPGDGDQVHDQGECWPQRHARKAFHYVAKPSGQSRSEGSSLPVLTSTA